MTFDGIVDFDVVELDVPSFDDVDPECDRCGGQGGTRHAPCPECMAVGVRHSA